VVEVDLDRRLRLRGDAVIWQQVEDEIIALELPASEYVAPNESARELWRLLAVGATPRELAEALIATWGLAAEEALRDASSFVWELQRRGLLEQVG
jgi:hypothetical protein